MPNVVVIAGPNGSGKSTTAPKLLRDTLKIEHFINADAIASGLSAFAPDRAAFPAGRIMLQRMTELAGLRENFALESTLSSRSLAPRIVKLRAKGYVVHLIFLWLLDVNLAVKRVAERVKAGGHGIPEEIVRRRYTRSIGNFFNIYRPIADSWLMLDNSLQDSPKPVAWRNIGGSVQITKSGPWNKLREEYEKDILQ